MNFFPRIVAALSFVIAGGVIVLASAQMSDMPGMNSSKSADATKDSSGATTTSHKKTLAPQTTCPVTGDPINKKLYVDYKGKRIYVCCASCINDVKKDPEKYIKKLESMGQSVEVIGAAKVVGAKALVPQKTCPVMGGAIDKSVFFDYKGKRVYFCCSGCPATFKADPEKYLKILADRGEAPIDIPK